MLILNGKGPDDDVTADDSNFNQKANDVNDRENGITNIDNIYLMADDDDDDDDDDNDDDSNIDHAHLNVNNIFLLGYSNDDEDDANNGNG